MALQSQSERCVTRVYRRELHSMKHSKTRRLGYTTRIPAEARPRWIGARGVHSTAACMAASSAQAETPAASTLRTAVKQCVANNATRKLLNVLIESENEEGAWADPGERSKPDASDYRTAIRALLRADRGDLAMDAFRLRTKARMSRPESVSFDPSLCAQLLKWAVRAERKRKDKAVCLEDVLSVVLSELENAFTSAITSPSILSGLVAVQTTLLNAEYAEQAAQVLKMMGKVETSVGVKEYNNLIRLYGKNKRIDAVFGIIDLMDAGNVTLDNESFEFLANAVVRNVEFVTGAVSMNTLPEPLAAEVAFVGRSNVGKSSLVNMLCNRKALAKVSGTPGKTQQFNYFVVNENDSTSKYYLVDLPGVGYARVPKHVRAKWLMFMGEYLDRRTSLRVVFHLIDGRHGALEDDEELMKTLSRSRFDGEYVVVLTKMDKMDKQKVKRSVLDKVRSALKRNECDSDTPIVLSSANTRMGRDFLWRHLQKALQSTVPAFRK